MRIASVTLVTVLIGVALVGCAGGTASKAAPTPKPTHTVSYATEAQVSSALAQYGDDFRKAIKGAFDCRWFWTIGTETFAEKMNAQTCYIEADTVDLQAANLIRTWGKMRIPPSLQSLVAETKAPLSTLAALDLTSACGTGNLPDESDECIAALGDQNAAFQELKSELAAWKPYGV